MSDYDLTPTEANELTIVEVIQCARCQKDHPIGFKRFKNYPVDIGQGIVFAWWGTCENTGEPVIMTTIDMETDLDIDVGA